MKRFWSAILYIFTGILVFLMALIGFSSLWMSRSWGDIDMDEIVFHLQQPLQGAGGGVIGDFLLKALLPTVVVLAVYILLIILLKKGKRRIICSCCFLAAVVVAAFFTRSLLWQKLDLGNWIEGRLRQSTFIEENYVDPLETKLTFPEKKRNLIYIYLESVETTFADQESGGAFKENTIPELTQIAMENEDFSGNEKELNGGIVYPGTGFTTGATFAQSAGLPLKISISANFMDTQSAFFPQVTAIGDILQDEGYRQLYLIGSDAVFGGRTLFFKDHGDFEIRDYRYAQREGWIDPEYEVWWGYEDEKLFDFAKDTLNELSAGEQPFCLTMLTVDTHYEDGYVCRLCRDDFPGNQYANVMACSSRQIEAFLSWIKEQDFYENTTVILAGDHTTMDTNFCKKVDETYQRKTYTAFINSAVSTELPEQKREYSTLDLFPTTLASIGVQIDGERLGLGTNLFSAKETLTEEYGFDYVSRELGRRSAFLEKMEKLDEGGNEKLMERLHLVFDGTLRVDAYDPDKKTALLKAANLFFYEELIDDSLGFDVEKVEVEYQEEGSETFESMILKKDPVESGCYSATIDLSSWSQPKGEFRLNIYTADGNVYNSIDQLSFAN